MTLIIDGVENKMSKTDILNDAFSRCGKPFWGLADVRFVYYNEWSDPEIFYNGFRFDYWDLWDLMDADLHELHHIPDDQDVPDKLYETITPDMIYGYLEELSEGMEEL